MISARSGSTRGTRLVPGILRLPLVFRHTLHTSCFNTTAEGFGEKGTKNTETLRDYLIRRILDTVCLAVGNVGTFFLVIVLVDAGFSHAEGTGDDEVSGIVCK